MFSSARIFSDVTLRLPQNLSLRGVRVQNINIGGGMGGEISNNKHLEYALRHLHRIGRSKAHHIMCELGVENKFVKDLSKRELYSFCELLSKYLIGNKLFSFHNVNPSMTINLCSKILRDFERIKNPQFVT